MRISITLSLILACAASGFAQTFSFTADTVRRQGQPELMTPFHAEFVNLLQDTQSINFHVDAYDFPDTGWTISICADGGCYPPGVNDINRLYDPLQRDTLVSFDVYMTNVGDSGHFSATLTAGRDPTHPQTIQFTIYVDTSDVVWNWRPVLSRRDLLSSYPNPFNSETTLEFSVPRTESAELIIYDVLGREVARVLDGGYLNAGIHHLRWSGESREGVPLPSGIYFVRLNLGGEFQMHQLYLLR
jgi:hypothetical protein